jgi:phosphoglycerate dehydrogenase-like enzyme
VRGAILVSEFVERQHAAALDRAAPGVARCVVGEDGPRTDPGGVEVAYFSGDLYPGKGRPFARALRQAQQLVWLHTFSAGVDDRFFQRLLERGVRLTNSSGAHAVPIAHTVLLYLLAWSRDLRGWLEAQARRSWEPRPIVDLQARVLGIVGLGAIGCEVARLAAAFGMRVIGTRRAPRGDEPCETWPPSRLHELLSAADYVVLTVPLTDETRHLVDAAALGCMRPHAVLVNVSRGAVVDETALVAALSSGRIAGAALDVFDSEPLPADSPLWTMRNVIVTPHSAGTAPGGDERATEIFLANLRRYVVGEPLRNEVRFS